MSLISQKDYLLAEWLAGGFIAAGVLANAIVLVLAAILRVNPRTRGMLKRQSLCLLLYTQAACLLLGASWLMNIIVDFVVEGPTPLCETSMFGILLSTNFINFALAFIAINLQLVVVHGINTAKWTKWYLGSAAFAAVVIPIPSMVYRVWGWDELTDGCWISLTDRPARLRWAAGTLFAWTLLSAAVALGSTCVVLAHLVRKRTATRRAFRCSMLVEDHVVARVAVRVVWYPILLVVYSAVELAAELGVDDGVSTMPEFVLWTLAGVFLGLFPFALGMLTIFVDPTFSSAVRTLLFPARRDARESVDSDATLTVGTHPLPKLARASSAGDVSVLQFTDSAELENAARTVVDPHTSTTSREEPEPEALPRRVSIMPRPVDMDAL